MLQGSKTLSLLITTLHVLILSMCVLLVLRTVGFHRTQETESEYSVFQYGGTGHQDSGKQDEVIVHVSYEPRSRAILSIVVDRVPVGTLASCRHEGRSGSLSHP